MIRTETGQTRPIDERADDELTHLMGAVQGGNQDAFATLYDHLSPLVFGVLVRTLHDRALAEDVTQEVFVEMWTLAARFDRHRGSVRAWAVTIARRRAIDRIRNVESQKRRVGLLAQRRADDDAPTADTVVDHDQAMRVRRAMTLLPPDQRDVVELTFLDGRSHAAAAEHLGIPLGTVKSRVRGALQRLATILKEES